MWFRDVQAAECALDLGDRLMSGSGLAAIRVESDVRRPARAGDRVVMSTAAREGLMREHEAGRRGSPWRWHSWFKRIALAVTQVSVVTLLGTGAESGLAARKNKSRGDDRGGGDQSAKDRDRGSDRDQDSRSENGRKEERKLDRENNDKPGRDGDGDSRNNDRGRKQERQADETTDVEAAASKKQMANRSHEAEQTNQDPENPEDPGATEAPENTENPEDTNNGGGGGGGGNGGRGDGGGNDAGNAGSGLFDSPLATKTRRRANDFDNANREDEDDGIIVDIDPDGESVYETDSILFASGPEGAEILTDNITFFAEPAPPPEPLPRLELPVRDPGYPFGEDFPFGDFPFGNTTVILDPTASEPIDPGDAAPAPVRRAEPIPTADQPAQANSDGGDYTMDFSS